MRNIEDPAILREKVVDEARRWVGTPYRHQSRVLNVGVDCVGLIIGVGLATGAMKWTEDRFAPWSGYGRLPNPRRMRAGLEEFLVEITAEEATDGDVPWFAWREGRPMHLGILTTDHCLGEPRPMIVHATSQIGSVVEHGFAAEWPGRVEGWWRYPALVQEGA